MNVRWFGTKDRFAMKVGDFYPTNRSLRLVEIWAAGQHLSCDDSWAYLPVFCTDLDWSIAAILTDRDRSLPWPELSPAETHRRLYNIDDGKREQFWDLLHWGPTTDNVSPLLFQRGQNVILTFEFWRPTHHNPADLGKIFTVELPERELLRVLHGASVFLRSTNEDMARAHPGP
jgi:hypothetical protein